MSSKKNKLYGIYDMKEKEICIGIYDNIEDIANRLKKGKPTIYSAITRANRVHNRYLIKKIGDSKDYE